MSEGTVTLPEIGKVKKVYVYAGVAVVGVAVVIYYRNRRASASSSSSTDTTAPADTSYAPGTDYSGSSGAGGGAGDTATQVTNGPPFSTNEAWAQYVTSYLVDTLGKDPGTVAADIGAYLAGTPVTQAVRDVINEATAYGGQPPKAGPNGYPPSINVSGSVTGTGSSPGPVTLTQGTVSGTTASVSWTPVTGATSYAWSAIGTGYSKTGTTTTSSLSLTGLKASTTYTVTVHAVNASGPGPVASIVVKTAAVAGTPAPPPGAAGYDIVTVVHFSSSNPAWNSTISGIAQHYGYGADWQAVWNDTHNAALRAKRSSPDNIQAGDLVAVKKR